jgi:hypothetical protein
MKKGKKTSLWIMGIMGALLVLLVAFLILFPRFVNLDPIKEAALARISEKMEGKVTFQRLDLTFFPRPHALIHQAGVSIPGKFDGTIESLALYPKVWPLLRGRLALARVLAQEPDFRVTLLTRRETKEEHLKPPLSAAIGKVLKPLLAPLATKAPNLIVEIENGRIEFTENEGSHFSFYDIEARLVFPPEELTYRLTCSSHLWEKMELEGRLDTGDFKGKVWVDLKNFRPHKVTNYLFPDTRRRLIESQVNLELELDFEGTEVIKGHLKGAFPDLVFQRGNKEVVLSGRDLRSAFVIDGKKIALSLTKLVLDHPSLQMSGEFLLDWESAPQIGLTVQGTDVDVHSTREAGLSLFGDIPNVIKFFTVLKGGKVPLVTVSTQGTPLTELKRLENYVIKGCMNQGNIFIPRAELDLTDVKGEATISKGVLQGKNLEAALGNSTGHKGMLELALKRKETLFHLDIMIDADLAQLPPILGRVVKNKLFVEEIPRIQEFEGTANGRLILGDSKAAIKARVKVSDFNLQAKYQRIPYPLEIHKGGLSCSETGIELTNLQGKLGRSTFSDLSFQVALKKEPDLELQSGRVGLLLDEIHPWLSSFETLPFLHSLERTEMKGLLLVSTLNLKGPLLKPQDWLMLATGQVQEIVFDSGLFPGIVKVSEADFHTVEDATKQEFHFKEAQISMLDASFILSGYLKDYRKGLNGAEIFVEGDTRGGFIEWLSGLIHIPREFRPRSPISVSGGQLLWERDLKTSFVGDLVLQDGLQISLDILKRPEVFMLRNLHVQDEDSQVSAKLLQEKKAFSVEFTGKLSKATIHRIFLRKLPYASVLEGDFKADILFDQPEKSTALGKLKGEDLIFPWGLKIPLKIGNLILDGQKDHVRVESAICTWGECRGALEGRVNFAETGYVFDMGLSSDVLVLDKLKRLFERDLKNKESDKLWDMPLQGAVRVNLGAFVYDDHFTWTPFQADVTFNPKKVEVKATYAVLCGISTPGVLEWTREGISLDFQPTAEKRELAPTVECLRGEQVKVTGLYDLKGPIRGQGKPDELIRSLQGNLELNATDGRIQRHIPLQKVFAYLNLTESLRGELPDMTKEAFPYKSITIKADIRDGQCVLSEAIIDSASIEIIGEGHIDFVGKTMDLTILVAPLRTIDWFIKRIPVVRGILQGTLFAIPIKVEGGWDDPTVTALAPSAIGSRLKGIMKRLFKVPFEFLNGTKQKEQPEPQE